MAMTRAQAATVILRMDELMNGQTPSTPSTPSVPSAPTVTDLPAFAFANSGETVDQMMARIIAAQPEYREGYLANGKPITMENIEELAAKVQEGIPAGTPWDNSRTYGLGGMAKWGAAYGMGCVAYAMAVQDYVFGADAPLRMHQNFDQIKPGDVVYSRNYAHSGGPASKYERAHARFIVGKGPLDSFYDEYGSAWAIDANPIVYAGHAVTIDSTQWDPEFVENTWVYTRY